MAESSVVEYTQVRLDDVFPYNCHTDPLTGELFYEYTYRQWCERWVVIPEDCVSILYCDPGVVYIGYKADGTKVIIYDKTGYDRFGYDRDGYDRKGYNRDGYDKDGNYISEKYNCAELLFNGRKYECYEDYIEAIGMSMNCKKLDLNDYTPFGGAVDEDGVLMYYTYTQWYTFLGYVIPNDCVAALGNINDAYIGYKNDGTKVIVYDKNGYDKAGFDREGYDKKGYDRFGYDKSGYNKDGYDKDGFNKEGYDKDGFNQEGFSKEGYDKNGCNKELTKDNIGVSIGGYLVDKQNYKIEYKKGIDIQKCIVYQKSKNDELVSLSASDMEKRNAKTVLTKEATNKKGYGIYNVSVVVNGVTIYNQKVMIVPNKTNAQCKFHYSIASNAQNGWSRFASTRQSTTSDIDGVQYTIGRVKNKKSKTFTKTYVKLTAKQVKKKGSKNWYLNSKTIKGLKVNETIYVKYRSYVLTSDNKKIYSEWIYDYTKLKK